MNLAFEEGDQAVPMLNGINTDLSRIKSGRVVQRSGIKSFGCTKQRASAIQVRMNTARGTKGGWGTSEDGVGGNLNNDVSRNMPLANGQPLRRRHALRTRRNCGMQAHCLVDDGI